MSHQANLYSFVDNDIAFKLTSSSTTSMEFTRMQIKRFEGLARDNSTRFLNDFESYCTYNQLNAEDQEARKVAAFYLHLNGPAITWINALPDTQKDTWAHLRTAFMLKYGYDDPNNPVLVAEGELFNRMTLGNDQSLEDFHAVLLDRGSRLQKPERDMISKFVQGLPAQLAFFVHAGNPPDLAQTLTAAKLGEAHGYRAVTSPPMATAAGPYDNGLAEKVDKLCSAVTALTMEHSVAHSREQPSAANRGQYRRQNMRRQCYNCGDFTHLIRECPKKNSEYKPSSGQTVQCQLCDKVGHSAKQCFSLGKHSEN